MFAKKALGAAPAAVPLYVEDVFSTYLWEGNATARNIVNGIDLAGEGGMVWTKYRNTTNNHRLYDTARGATKEIYSSLTNAESTASQSLTAFNADGFSLGTGQPNENTATVVGWTFRKQEKFFDVVTYTGNATNRTISHNLGSTPGCYIVKRTDSTSNWFVWHRSLGGNDKYVTLNSTNAASTSTTHWNNTGPTSTTFSIGTDTDVNTNGATYVVYLFAHDAGGFGASGSDSVIKCGSFTTDGSGDATVTLGYEPQFVITKRTDSTGDWWMLDVMRGMPIGGNNNYLNAQSSAAEGSGGQPTKPSATGFTVTGTNASATFIYIAIRRGPMKTPTSGTSVFAPVTYTGTSATQTVTAGFPVDLSIIGNRSYASIGQLVNDRLRGATKSLNTTDATAEFTDTTGVTSFASNTAITLGTSANGYVNDSGRTYVDWNFRRAPGFFDVVCYTGTGSNTTVTHNLGVAPEMMIVKHRNGPDDWAVYHSAIGNTKYLWLNSTNAESSTAGSTYWNSTTPTSSVFSLGTQGRTNDTGGTYVAYLFASCPGVSKVGNYTGNGSNQTINCGFTAGARFVLIKRTDSTGDWVVFDSARGIVAGNDLYLELNTTDAEVTDKDAVDTDNSGFVVNETSGPNVNTNSATYIYLAIA